MLRTRLILIGVVLVMTAGGGLHWWLSPRLFEARARLRLPHDPTSAGPATGLDENLRLSTKILEATCTALRHQNAWLETDDPASRLQERLRFEVVPEGDSDDVCVTLTTPAAEIDSAVAVLQIVLDAWIASCRPPRPSGEMAEVSQIVADIEAQRKTVVTLEQAPEGLPASGAEHATLEQHLQTLQTAIAEAQIDRDEAERMHSLVRQAIDGQMTLEICASRLTDHHIRSRALALLRRGQLEAQWQRSRVQLAKFETVYGAAHPRMVELQNTIETLQDEFVDDLPVDDAPSIEDRLLALVAEQFRHRTQVLSDLTARVTESASRLKQSQERQTAVQAAREELNTLESRRTALEQRAQQTQSAHPTVEILAPPVLSPEPTSPGLWQELGLGLLSGLGLAVVCSYRRPGARTPR